MFFLTLPPQYCECMKEGQQYFNKKQAFFKNIGWQIDKFSLLS